MAFSTDSFRKRLTELRIQKDVSENRMSLDLGMSGGYIQQISSGRSLPSMKQFLAICEYLGVEPMEFFDIDNREPALTRELLISARSLSEDKIKLLIAVSEGFQHK